MRKRSWMEIYNANFEFVVIALAIIVVLIFILKP